MATTTEASTNTSRAMADDSTISTVADPTETEKSANELERRRSIQQAIDEGHDADIPNNTGQMLPEVLESKRRRSSAAKADIEKEADLTGIAGAKGHETELAAEDDPNVIFWDGPDDPENPYNWPTWRKITLCAIISFMTFITPLASSIFAPGVPGLMKEFQSRNTELASFVVSVYILGFAFGPLVMAPLSEIYGRVPIYHVSNVCYIGFTVGCALAPTLDALIVFRFLAGVFGSTPITNGGGSIADMIAQEHRAKAMAGFSIGPLLGPIIGPVAGGFLADAAGWRWVFWLLVILGGVQTTTSMIFMRETFAPVLLQRRVDKLKKETGNLLLRSKLDAGLSPRDYFKRGIIRPLKLLAFSPITQIFAVYMAIVYGYLYLMFTSLTQVFQGTYGFSTKIVGLVFLGLGVGSMVGLAGSSIASDRYMKSQAEKEGQGMKPEYRLIVLPLGAIILPIGFFIYGWTAQYHVHWIVPIIGTAIIGVSNLIVFMAISMYLVDAFAIYAASAMAANTVARSIAGAVLPLAGLRMYEVLGLGWGNSLLGFIALAMVPVPFILQRYGERLRTKYEVKNL